MTISPSKTEKLYYIDSHMRSFEAKVLSCEAQGDRFAIILDRTAFFPEGGGQVSDTGRLGEANVLDVQMVGGEIIHYTDAPVAENTAVTGELDWESRFRKMQNHSGEHVVCGLVHRMYGYDNVGFHLGSQDVTLDLNGELDREQIREIELLANRVVAENVDITAECLSDEQLVGLEYRSKLELTEDVRIVTIEGYDRCACCAPHVSKTGEIGMIKLLDFMRYKGGVRIHLQCGLDALEDYNEKYDNVAKISALLSAPQERTAEYVERTLAEIQQYKQRICELNRQIIELKLRGIEETKGNRCFIEQDLGADELRAMVNSAVEKTGGICAAFSGNDESGYNYVIGSRSVPLRSKAKEINSALSGKGGGTDAMIQGSVKASAAQIKAFFEVE